MKSLPEILAIVLVIACLTSSSTTLQAQDHEAMIAAATALDDAFVAAINSGDTDKLASLYWNSPDLVSFPPGSLMDSGYEAVMGNWKAFLAASPGATLEVHYEGNIVAGEYVVSYGMFSFAIPTPDGTVQEMKGRFTDVKAQRDGKWVYVHDHGSVPLPPPPTEQ